MFYCASLLHWWPIVAPRTSRSKLDPGWALPYLHPPFLEDMLIGALLKSSSEPPYATNSALNQQPVWGLNWLDDTELGGLIIWVPGGMFVVNPLIGIVSRLLADDEEGRPRAATVRS